MRLSLILAVARNGVIGRDGAIPWRISTDMRRFRSLTLDKPIVMGRKQYDSVGRPLEGRDNIVITRNLGFAPPGVHRAGSLGAALEVARECVLRRGGDEVMIIGGAQIYALALPMADRLYLSRVKADVDGDVRFEIGSFSDWNLVAREEVPAGPKDEHPHTFCVLDRVRI